MFDNLHEVEMKARRDAIRNAFNKLQSDRDKLVIELTKQALRINRGSKYCCSLQINAFFGLEISVHKKDKEGKPDFNEEVLNILQSNKIWVYIKVSSPSFMLEEYQYNRDMEENVFIGEFLQKLKAL